MKKHSIGSSEVTGTGSGWECRHSGRYILHRGRKGYSCVWEVALGRQVNAQGKRGETHGVSNISTRGVPKGLSVG